MFAQNISFVCSLKLQKALKEKAFTNTHVDMCWVQVPNLQVYIFKGWVKALKEGEPDFFF